MVDMIFLFRPDFFDFVGQITLNPPAHVLGRSAPEYAAESLNAD